VAASVFSTMSHNFSGLCVDDLASCPPPLLGDYYREPDDIVRGLTIDSSALCFDSVDDLWGSSLSGHWEPLKPIFAPTPIRSRQTVQIWRFQESEEGRRVPEDPCFFHEKTTQFLPGVSPAKAGNRVLDFFEQEIPSSITKVNHKKLTIKADAFHGSLSCQLKVYIYLQELGCAVEFQRRKGDAIAFQGIYDKAAKYLSEHIASQGHLQTESAIFSEAPKPPGLGLKHLHLPCSEPLFEIEVENKDSSSALIQTVREAPYLQDEVAGSILGAAEEEELQDLAGWCEPEGVEVLLELLASDRFVCAYPAARLLARLADLPEARSHFLKQGLLKSVLPRLWVQATGMAVWLQLAHLVHTLVLGYASHMTSNEIQESAASIATALQFEPFESSARTACVGQHLREALSVLS